METRNLKDLPLSSLILLAFDFWVFCSLDFYTHLFEIITFITKSFFWYAHAHAHGIVAVDSGGCGGAAAIPAVFVSPYLYSLICDVGLL